MSRKASPDHTSMAPDVYQPVWKKRELLWCIAIAIALGASWVLAPFSEWWDAADEATFNFLNGRLKDSQGNQVFWALANHRSVDLVSGSICALIFLSWLWTQPREEQAKRCAMLAALAIPVVILPFIVHEIIERVFFYERHSPSVVFEHALRLTQLVPEYATKDASRWSFPGDHAFVLSAYFAFFALYRAWRWVAMVGIISVIFLLPRLVAGAHWLTDNTIGGVVPALLVVAVMLATPLGPKLANKLLPLTRAILGLFPDWFLLPAPQKNTSGKA